MAGLRSDPILVSPVVISIGISLLGVIISVCTSMFISGAKWGELKQKVDAIDRRSLAVDTLQTDVAVMKHDVAEIKGMFTMKLKDPS